MSNTKNVVVLSSVALAAVLLGGCCDSCCAGKSSVALAGSPDGRNVIRLCLDPLSYEVKRDGVVVAARTPIDMKVDGTSLAKGAKIENLVVRKISGKIDTPVYKKSQVDLSANETFADFGDWGVRLVARNDGVAYRFETSKKGTITVDGEKAGLCVPDAAARIWANKSSRFGCEETVAKGYKAADLTTNGKAQKGGSFIYLPLVYTIGGKTVAVTESDVRNYPVWNLTRTNSTLCCGREVCFDSLFAGFPIKRERVGGWGGARNLEKGGRWVRVTEHADYLLKVEGTRTFPWRTFILVDKPSDLCQADIVYALASPAAAGSDFSWVKPGKVAWDWWNCFDNQGSKGCNTKTYKRFIDFAAKFGVEYVILDEGWSASLDIWKFHPNVDVPAIIEYARKKGVGIILWMAWAQVYGEEEKVAAHFAKLGAKGFKVDFMDRGDAEVALFLEKFASACAKHKMLVDYHGVYRPVGMQRMYPNIVNYEGVHGLEQAKWYNGSYDFMSSDLMVYFLRMTAGPMDYTPGAMDNHAIGTYKGNGNNPGSVGTRCRQMAMMAMYEAPLQMLCDSPTKYEKNIESFRFMAATPVVWDDTLGLGGDPDSYAAVARRKGDVWYAAAMTDATAREIVFDTAFLGGGEWKAEIFRDAPDSDVKATAYVHETKSVKAGEKMSVKTAKGGGFVMRFTK